jgi:hypothetical protein
VICPISLARLIGHFFRRLNFFRFAPHRFSCAFYGKKFFCPFASGSARKPASPQSENEMPFLAANQRE